MSGIIGMEDLERTLREVSRTVPHVLERGLTRIGLLAQSEAKAYAPRSPTNAQVSATLKRKRRTARKMFPGGLEKSIEWEIVGSAPTVGCSVFIAQNGYSKSRSGFNYAPKIHDERGKTWKNLGPGSIAKNTSGKVGEKFIQRAIEDNADKFVRILLDETRKANL